MARLGVNIDHVATVRQARKTTEPDPVWAASLAELGGADGITFHLREDRRHMQDRDARILIQTTQVPTNLELSTAEEVVALACELKPTQATLVPERREEVTTEGGLDVAGQQAKVGDITKRLQDAGLVVSLFIDPDPAQVEASIATGAQAIELHTGAYAHASTSGAATTELIELAKAGEQITAAGLLLNVGHGLTYRNVKPVASLAGMHELNIGHSIISRAVMVGLEQAVRDMKRLVAGCRG